MSPSGPGGGGRANLMTGPLPGADQLTRITTKGGVSATVNKDSAPYMLGFLNYLEAHGAPIREVGGESVRHIAGSSRWSQHAYGNAIDINQIGRNVTTGGLAEWARKNQAVLEEAERKYHMVGGWRWRNPDFGHWEYGGGGAKERAPSVTLPKIKTPPALEHREEKRDPKLAPLPDMRNFGLGLSSLDRKDSILADLPPGMRPRNRDRVLADMRRPRVLAQPAQQLAGNARVRIDLNGLPQSLAANEPSLFRDVQLNTGRTLPIADMGSGAPKYA
jgi:hypothetical protein